MINRIEFEPRDLAAVFVEYLDYALALLSKGEVTASVFYFKRAQRILVEG